MARQLFELVGADPARRFSPFCWRTRMALAHKGLEAEVLPWRFTESERLAGYGHKQVPILLEPDGRAVFDSYGIANYLEAAYPDAPSLFGGPGGQAMARFIGAWADGTIHPLVARCVVKDIHDWLGPECQAYFRTSREKRFGATLEAVQAGREQTVQELRQALSPLRFTLTRQAFLGGEAPSYADYIVFGAFMWARNVSAFRLLEPDDAVFAWRARLLAAHGGVAGASLGYDV